MVVAVVMVVVVDVVGVAVAPAGTFVWVLAGVVLAKLLAVVLALAGLRGSSWYHPSIRLSLVPSHLRRRRYRPIYPLSRFHPLGSERSYEFHTVALAPRRSGSWKVVVAQLEIHAISIVSPFLPIPPIWISHSRYRQRLTSIPIPHLVRIRPASPRFRCIPPRLA